MEKDRVLAILREHAPELMDAGVMHLRVFGSVARGDASSCSDVDLLADFDKSRRLTLVTLGGLESRPVLSRVDARIHPGSSDERGNPCLLGP